ncbi:MAG TPA: hypothetical protein VMF30_07280 [Pirellulales bacterium]|nr:hypothetical protein [Pirellulales bacterium]
MAAVLLSTDLLGMSKITGAAQRAGCRFATAASAADLMKRLAAAPAGLVVIDLGTTRDDLPQLVSSLQALPQPPAAIIAFGPHVHEERLQQARDAGCDAVLARGQFHAAAEAIFAEYSD